MDQRFKISFKEVIDHVIWNILNYTYFSTKYNNF